MILGSAATDNVITGVALDLGYVGVMSKSFR